MTFPRNLDWDQEVHDGLFWLHDLIFIFSDNGRRAWMPTVCTEKGRQFTEKAKEYIARQRAAVTGALRACQAFPGAASIAAHHFHQTPLCFYHQSPHFCFSWCEFVSVVYKNKTKYTHKDKPKKDQKNKTKPLTHSPCDTYFLKIWVIPFWKWGMKIPAPPPLPLKPHITAMSFEVTEEHWQASANVRVGRHLFAILSK